MQHKGRAYTGLSGGVWGNLPVKNWAVGMGGQFRFQNSDGLDMQDDGAAWADGTTNLGMKSEQGAGSTIVVASDVTKEHCAGVIQLTTDGGDGDDCSLATALPVINIKDGGGRWAFEARIKPSSIADDQIHGFVGLTSAAVAANSTLTGGDLADVSCVGFLLQDSDGDDLRAGVSDASGNAGIANMNVSADGSYLLKTADFYNVGAVFDGERIRMFVSGVKSDESSARSVLLHEVKRGDSEFTGTSDVNCYFEMAGESGGSGAESLSIEWFAYGQEFIDF